ncbi:MAG: hypothetical protein WBM90_11110 [Acidimicrobiia bacterium]
MKLRILLVLVALAAVACSPADSEATTTVDATTSTDSQPVATTEPAPTTTAAPVATTTTATSTPSVSAVAVEPTPTVGVLLPYGPGGEELFEPGSVEAHWYQWNNFYVVLYRGYDASTGNPICAGNSILVPGVGFNNVTNSPINGTADSVCVDAARIAEQPAGARACGALLYYVTEIPTDLDGDLYGTLELNDGSGWIGQTSSATSDLANTPMFEPDQTAYELPPSDVAEGGLITCG